MEKSSASTMDLVTAFADSVGKYSYYIFKDPKSANRHYRKFTKALRRLALLGDHGFVALGSLLNHENTAVRVTAASYLINYSTEDSIRVLTEAKKAKNRAVSMLAIVTLKRWEMGSYLDPATGREIKRQNAPAPKRS
jgi:hypothetical protein